MKEPLPFSRLLLCGSQTKQRGKGICGLILPGLLTALYLLVPVPLPAQDDSATVAAVREEPNEKAAKYHEALVRRPSGGYLFERFFNAWLDTGSVAGMEDFLTRRADANRADIGESLLLAYFYSKQGNDNKASGIFEKALAGDPENAEAWFEKAKIEARLLHFDKAIADLGKATAAAPKDDVAIEIGKLKGRLLARAGRSEEALATWNALASTHVEDGELQEDLVELHLTEGLLEEAVTLMADLIEKTDDPYLKITRQLRLGDIYQRSGKREEAIDLYGTSLAASGRDTWLEKEILAQIEHVFRREDDIAGLNDHLATLIDAESGRIALMKRRALVLAELQESDEAAATFTEILKLTPGDRENQEMFVELLGRIGKHAEAAEQMAALAALHPGDAEVMAQLAVRQHTAGRTDAAIASVKNYLKTSDGSEYAYLRAARLLEQFKEDGTAGEIYGKLVAAFPESVSAKESQAEFLHRTGKTEQSLALWKSLAASGTGLDALRAARALSSRGERESAYEILRSRAEEFSTDFSFLGQLCAEAIAVEQYEEALPWAERRLSLVKSSVDLNDAMRLVVSILDKLERIPAHVETLKSNKARTLPETCLLSELLERDGQYEAAEAILLPELEAGATLAISQQVRRFRSREEWVKAAETQRRLVDLPGGRNSANVQDLARLYRRALQYEAALQWIEEWKKLSPGATQPWVEHSSLLMETDKGSEAIAVLRSAVQRFEDQPELRSQLAGLHLQEGSFAEAERLYWTLYEESEEISQKIRWAGSLADVATSVGRVEALLEQFEERRRGNRTSIAPLLAIAEIHRRDNNYEGRREALLEATRLRPEDLKLLHEIARIEEEEGDWEGASDTLRSALSLDKTENTRERLALMELRYGDEEEGFRQLLELKGAADMDADAILSLADAMIARSDWNRAGDFLASHRGRFPDDYRLVYLQAVALVEEERTEEARSLFLKLLAWETEVAKTAATSAMPAIPAEVLAAQKKLEEQIPKGTSEFTDFRRHAHSALYYRQLLRQQSLRFRQYSGMTGATSLVAIPTSLEQVKGFAKVHLLDQAHSMDEEARNSLAAEMTAQGMKSADILLQLPFPGLDSGGPAPFPTELLDTYPDRLDLWTVAATSQFSFVHSTPESIDTDLMGRSYGKFRADYPELAFACAVNAACSGTEEGAALLRKALAEIPLSDEPSSLVTSMVTNAVRGKSPFTGGRDSLLPDEFRIPFIEKVGFWREASQREGTTRNNPPAARFNIYDIFSWSLRSLPELERFADHLDKEIALYEKLRREKPSDLQMGMANQTRQLLSFSRNRRFLATPEFPPINLTDFPPNVLIHFTPLPEYGNPPMPLDPEKVMALTDRIKSPVLKVMFAHLAGDEARTEREIEALLANKSTSGLPELQIHLLASAFFGSIKSDPARAVVLLEEVRTRSMSKDLRRSIDQAIVAYATMKSDSTDVAATGDISHVLTAGREAALRLRYGRIDPSHRGELIAALTTLGLEEEAGQLRDKATPSGNRSSRASMAYGNPSARGLDDRVNKLVTAGKIDEAVKLSLQSLRPSLKFLASGNAGAQVDYGLMQFVQYLSKNSTLFAAVKKELDPGDPAVAKGEALLEWGAFQEILGEFDEALAAYRAGLRAIAPRKRPGIERKVTAILCYTYPKNAAKFLAEYNATDFQILAGNLQFIDQSRNYGQRDAEAQLARALNLGRTFIFWLEETDEETLAKLDLSSLDYPVRQKVADQFFGGSFAYLPELYGDFNPHRSWDRNPSQLDAAKAREATRRQIHDDLCHAMVRSPQLARRAFSYLAGLRMHDDAERAFTDPELESLARLALTNTAKLPRHTPGSFTQRSIHLNRKVVVPWSPEDFLIWLALRKGEPSAESVMELVRATKQRDLIHNAGHLHDLAFCAPSDFGTVAKNFLRRPGHANQHHGGGAYTTFEGLAPSAKLFAIWEARREELKGFDMPAFAIEAAKPASGPEAVLAVLLIEKTVREEGFEMARPILENLALALLGERAKWGEFVKSAQIRVNTSSGSYYMQGGEFTNPRHILFTELMQRLCHEIDTVLPVATWLRDEGLDTHEQITQSTLVPHLSSQRLSEDPSAILALFKNSPFFGDVATFRSLNRGRVNVLRDILEQVKKNGSAKNRLREAAVAADTFGGALVAAYLSDRPKTSVAEVLGNHREGVEATLANNDTGDLAAFVNSIYNDGSSEYDTLSENARAVLDLLGTERMKTAREAAADFLALKDLKSLQINGDRDLERHLLTLLPALWSARDWELGVQVYWHGVDLARREIKAGSWNGDAYSGWNVEGDVLHDVVNGAPGSDLERIALFERVLASDKEGRIPVTRGGMGFAGDLRSVFNQFGGEANLEAAMAATVAALHEVCGNDPAVRLSFYLVEMARQLRPALAPRLVVWADAKSEGEPWSPIAKELGQALRMEMQTSLNAAYKPLAGEVENIETWQDHYIAVIQNDTRTIPWRIAVADEVCDSHATVRPDTAMACATLLAEALASDAPINTWHVHRLAMQFNKLEKTPEWEALARRLHEGWVFKNRNNQKPNSSGLAFLPGAETVLAMLEMHLKWGDLEATRKFHTEKNAFERVKSNARTLFILVSHGDFEGAALVLREGVEFMDITDDYVVASSYTQVRYSPRTHEQLPLFLETIDDPAMRYFAELIVLGAFDPAPELREADATYPGRAGRLAGAAKRFTEIDFGASPRGALVRERVIQQITSTDPSASILESLLEKEYRDENCLLYCNLDNYKKIEHASRPLGAFAALRLRSGDISIVEDMIDAANRSTTSDYYRRSALRYFSLRLLDSLKHRAPQAKPDEWAAYSSALGLLLSETKDEILEHNNIATIIGAHLAASVRSGRVTEFTAWAEALPPARAEILARKIRRTPQPCWASFGQILKTKVPDPAIRPGPEAREQMLSTLVVNPLIDRTYRLHDPFFRFAVDHGMLSVEEVRGDPGRRLEALFPRNGYSAIEIARYHADAGDWDAALEWAAKAITRLAPDKLGGPYARIAMRRIEILLEAKRGAEAEQAISDLERKVDFTKLPADLRQSHATLRKRIKI